jgi:hypothetical protein
VYVSFYCVCEPEQIIKLAELVSMEIASLGVSLQIANRLAAIQASVCTLYRAVSLTRAVT